jgi:hypothetical protein
MRLTMDPDVRDELIKRLRSGDYIQGKEKLALKDDDGQRFCCLGVLCEMAVEAGITQRDEREEEHWDYDTDDEGIYVTKIAINYGTKGLSYDSTLPPEVAVWAGILSQGEAQAMSSIAFDDGPGMGRFGGRNQARPTDHTLAGMNDDGVPFGEIADFIEKNAVAP